MKLLQVRSKKSLAVEVDQVRWGIRAPNLRLPRNYSKVSSHNSPRRKRCDVHETRFRFGEKLRELFMAFAIYRAVASDGVN